jgi:hypothetical protein
MFNSAILDVAIGLVFCFASVALFVSVVNEAIASALKLRHKTLLAGIKLLLNDPDGSGLVLKLYTMRWSTRCPRPYLWSRALHRLRANSACRRSCPRTSHRATLPMRCST